MVKIEDYNYHLPEALIAQFPVDKRDRSRLLMVDRPTGSLTDRRFFELPSLLGPGDLLVVNNTRVVPARIFGQKESGGKVEVLVLEHSKGEGCKGESRLCLLKSSRRPKPGSRIFFEGSLSGDIEEVLDRGLTRISFKAGEKGMAEFLAEKGILPLPPYIKRSNDASMDMLDEERYQTVYAERAGAVAAPTAGLHFTKDLITELQAKGVKIAPLTLHVGYGTFRPVETEDIREHRLDEEQFVIEPRTAKLINATRADGGRVFAVGTTVVRTLETAWTEEKGVCAGAGKTGLLITPGFQFHVVDGLITNFHLPKSSLLFLVSAFAGFELTKKAYSRAVQQQYRFYSYGDAMLIL
ncbi:MAG: tRNA preQ1(34) S-adenosylmethionine ribosyltransferase-isomerase QueA [Deltaproteobacteria bacterium]|nr:tRNA preQ1(34) S-adenosylmethionine ribosyltransferase-isomerase QueA [Deltaproteobacteria bacterium]